MDIRNIFVVMGDPTAIGDYPEAMDDYDLVPSGLISLRKKRSTPCIARLKPVSISS